MKSALKEKNLFVEEQILSFKSLLMFRRESKLKMEELLPMKVSLFTLKGITMYLPTFIKYSHSSVKQKLQQTTF